MKLTRADWQKQFRDRSIPLEQIKQSNALAPSVQESFARADLNQDGFVHGESEQDILFTSLDRFDRNGDADSIDVSRGGQTLALGRVHMLALEASREIASPSAPSTPSAPSSTNAPSAPSAPSATNAPIAPSSTSAPSSSTPASSYVADTSDAPADKFKQFLSQHPELRTHQDLVNHLLHKGQNWAGAQRLADRLGLNLNDLIQSRDALLRTGGVEDKRQQALSNILQVARHELSLGVTEDAGPNEDSRGHLNKYRNAVSGPGYPQNRGPEAWCADFVSYVFKEAGAPLGDEGRGFAYVPFIVDWSKQNNMWHETPKPGDIAVLDFRGVGPHHVGVVDEVYPDGSFSTIEGNLFNSVKRRGHDPSPDYIVGFSRPLSRIN